MLDETRVQAWEREAQTNLARFYSTDNPTGNMAAIVLALIADREERERYCARVNETKSGGTNEP